VFRLIRVRSNVPWHGGKKNDEEALPVKNLDQLIDCKQEYEQLREALHVALAVIMVWRCFCHME